MYGWVQAGARKSFIGKVDLAHSPNDRAAKLKLFGLSRRSGGTLLSLSYKWRSVFRYYRWPIRSSDHALCGNKGDYRLSGTVLANWYRLVRENSNL